MPESTRTTEQAHTEQPEGGPAGPVDVPLPFLLAISVPAVAVVLYIVAQLWGAAERRELQRAHRVLEEAGELPEEDDDDAA